LEKFDTEGYLLTIELDNKLRELEGKLPLPAICEQLAEECAELAQASIKMSRHLRGENPARISEDEIRSSLREEYNDVLLCIALLEYSYPDCCLDIDQVKRKIARWAKYLDGDE
jgi:NTP pyrophosphatase (non-canonical NTP hydrolase)